VKRVPPSNKFRDEKSDFEILDANQVDKRRVPWLSALSLLQALLVPHVQRIANFPSLRFLDLLILLVVPGSFLAAIIGVRARRFSSRLIIAVSFSLIAIMVTGWCLSFVHSAVPSTRPLDSAFQQSALAVLSLAALTWATVRRRDPVIELCHELSPLGVISLVFSLSLVGFSAIGASIVNKSGSGRIATFAIAAEVVALIAGSLWGWKENSRAPLGALLYSSSLGLLLSTSLRGQHVYGYDIQHEYWVAKQTIAQGFWMVPHNHDAYASMLSLTVLPTSLHSLTGLDLLTFFRLVIPALLALLPLAMYSASRDVPRWIKKQSLVIRPGLAFAVVGIFVDGAYAFPTEMAAIARQTVAFVLVGALLVSFVDRQIKPRVSRRMIFILTASLTFTHYSTAFMFVGVFVTGALVSSILQRFLNGEISMGVFRRQTRKRHRLCTWGLAFWSLLTAGVWNVWYTANNALSLPLLRLYLKGLQLKGNTVSHTFGAADYQRVTRTLLKPYSKAIHYWPVSRNFRLAGNTPPTVSGVWPRFFKFYGPYEFWFHELLLAMTVLAIGYMLFRVVKDPSRVSSDLLAIGTSAILFGFALRFSGALAAFFNADRAALFVSVISIVPMVLFLSKLAERQSVLTGLFLTVSVLSAQAFTSGLGVELFGGSPASALSARGAAPESFIIMSPELAAAKWLQANVGPKGLVQVDTYAGLALEAHKGAYNVLQEVVPGFIAKGGYLYASSVNIQFRRAYGSVPAGSASYEFPLNYVNHHMSVVFSTGSTRVYH